VETIVAGGVLYLDDCHVTRAKFMRSLFSYFKSKWSEVFGSEKKTKSEYVKAFVNCRNGKKIPAL
jgi:hypothetical protein